jgi:hypothetical protein
MESLRQIASAVVRGARAGVQKEINQSGSQTEIARAHLKEAVAGLDVALAQLVEALKLAVEDGVSRAQAVSNENLKQVRSDLKRLEAMFLLVLQREAGRVKDAAGEILHDLVAYTRTHGSAVGAQMKEPLSTVARELGATGSTQARAGLHLAQATSDVLRQVAAGMLAGLADHVTSRRSQGKGD